MVIADRTNDSAASNYSSNKPSRSLAASASASSGANGSSSEMNSDSDTEPSTGGSVRVGFDFQAEIPDYCLPKPAAPDYPEKALMVWTPEHDIEDEKIREYLSIAGEKYNYNPEQALGVLFWHKFNLECALADLANFMPYPDEWTMEDKALFEQAYTFYNKNFHKINTLLPDKKLSSLVKFYYTWKKVKSKSFIEKQMKKSNSQAKDDSTDSATNDAGADSDTEFEAAPGSSNSLVKECANCSTRKAPQYYNTALGLLCRSCFSAKRKDGSLKPSNGLEEGRMSSNLAKEDQSHSLPKNVTSMLFDQRILTEIAREREIPTKSIVLEKMDGEIDRAISKIREQKQQNAALKESIAELPDMPLLIQNPNRIISRWNESEALILTQAIHDYGRDFKLIAEILGNKTEQQIRNYYLQNQERLKDVLNEHYAENDLEEEMDADEAEETKGGRTAK